MENFFDNKRVAFQFSGGKDSLAALTLLEPYWSQMTVYWLNSGDTVPEVKAAVYTLAEKLPHFVEVTGDVLNVRREGIPSDLVAADANHLGGTFLGHGLRIQDRNECCIRSLMLPLAARMKEDGIEVIIRGQKLSDKRKSPIRSGETHDGVFYWFPLELWDDVAVKSFLARNGVALPEYYSKLQSSPDCLHCTAYLDEGRKEFLINRYPVAWAKVRADLVTINATVEEALAPLRAHLEV